MSTSRDHPYLRLMTFNIRYGRGDEGTSHAWDLRRQSVMDVIRAYDPDIISTQEALDYQIDALHEGLPEYARVGVGRADGHRGDEFCAIFFKMDRCYSTQSGTFWLSETPDLPSIARAWRTDLPRICTWSRFIDLQTRQEFAVFNTHLAHNSDQARELGVLLILSKIQEIAPDYPAILTGDFNASSKSRVYSYLTDKRSGFFDTYLISPAARENSGEDRRRERVATFHNWSGKSNERGSHFRMDFIFATSHFTRISCEIDTNKYAGCWPSDHFPVISVLDLQ